MSDLPIVLKKSLVARGEGTDSVCARGLDHDGTSVDPELMIRMLLVGYCFGIRSERRLCEAADKKIDVGDQEPSFGAGDSAFEVFGETTVASEPGEGALDHPAFGLGFESAGLLRMPDDFDSPAAKFGDRVRPLATATRPPDATPWRQKKRQQKPFRIRRITCIAAATTPILLTGGFSPYHCDLHRIFANPTESQRAEITPPIFGQALRFRRRVVARRIFATG
jgi:Transposase domain (DUF772)